MRRRLLTFVLAVAPVWGASLTTADRDALLSNFTKSTAMFTKSVEGLSVEQWNYKAGPDRWSIGECAE
ncbi:MAG: hypothetical protein ABI972_26420, partial [Acidobacteriota bacterium]